MSYVPKHSRGVSWTLMQDDMAEAEAHIKDATDVLEIRRTLALARDRATDYVRNLRNLASMEIDDYLLSRVLGAFADVLIDPPGTSTTWEDISGYKHTYIAHTSKQYEAEVTVGKTVFQLAYVRLYASCVEQLELTSHTYHPIDLLPKVTRWLRTVLIPSQAHHDFNLDDADRILLYGAIECIDLDQAPITLRSMVGNLASVIASRAGYDVADAWIEYTDRVSTYMSRGATTPPAAVGYKSQYYLDWMGYWTCRIVKALPNIHRVAEAVSAMCNMVAVNYYATPNTFPPFVIPSTLANRHGVGLSPAWEVAEAIRLELLIRGRTEDHRSIITMPPVGARHMRDVRSVRWIKKLYLALEDLALQANAKPILDWAVENRLVTNLPDTDAYDSIGPLAGALQELISGEY